MPEEEVQKRIRQSIIQLGEAARDGHPINILLLAGVSFLIFGFVLGFSGDNWQAGLILISIGLLVGLIWLGIMLSPRLLQTAVRNDAAQVARRTEANRQRAMEAASLLPIPSLLMLFFTIVGIPLLAMGTAAYLEARDSQDWPSAEGHVVNSRIVSDTRRDNDGDEYTRYRADVTYEYTVQGQAYTSNRLNLSDFNSSRDRSRAMQELEAYPRGGEVTVYYNPKNPGRSLLERSMPPYTYIICGLGLLGLAAMLGLLVLAVRRDIVKATGEAPPWEELIFWLGYIPGRRA